MGTLVLNGATSGSTTLSPVDAVTATITLPSATATVATLAGTETLSNKTITATGNISTSGTAVISSGNSVESTGPIQAHAASKTAVSLESSGSCITAYGANTSTYGTLRLRYAFSNGGTTNGLTLRGSNGCIGIAVDSPTYQIQATSNANDLAYFYQTSTGNGVYLPLGNNSWSAASDERLKDIIEPITDAANKVSTLRAVIGKYKTDEECARRPFIIAQDVQKVLPEAVDDAPNKDEDGKPMMGVQYTNLIPLLVAAIKELTARIEKLEAK
jgi:hypothetical protein